MNRTSERYPWPETTREAVERDNLLYALSGRVRTTLGGKPYRISFPPRHPETYRAGLTAALGAAVTVGATATVEATTTVGVEGNPAGNRFRLELDRIPVPELLGYPAGGVEAADLPPALLRSLMEGAFGAALERAERILGRRVAFVSVEAAGAGIDGEGEKDEVAIPFRMDREAGGEGIDRILGRLVLERNGATLLAKELAREFPRGAGSAQDTESSGEVTQSALPAPEGSAPPEGGTGWSGLRIGIRFRIGSQTVSLEEWAGMEAGDILLMDGNPGSTRGLRLCAGARDAPLWTATWKDERAILDEEYRMENVEKAAPQAGERETIGSLEVRLDFDLGGRNATLAELRALGPGSVFELPENPEARVVIRSGGRPVGAGSLILVDGRAGVRVESLWAGASHDG